MAIDTFSFLARVFLKHLLLKQFKNIEDGGERCILLSVSASVQNSDVNFCLLKIFLMMLRINVVPYDTSTSDLRYFS